MELNRDAVMAEIQELQRYINGMVNELNKPDLHIGYINGLAFSGINRFKTIANECKSVMVEEPEEVVDKEPKGVIEEKVEE